MSSRDSSSPPSSSSSSSSSNRSKLASDTSRLRSNDRQQNDAQVLKKFKSVICNLETYVGNTVDWKHKSRLDSLDILICDSKQKIHFGNNEVRLETQFAVSKQSFEVGNI